MFFSMPFFATFVFVLKSRWNEASLLYVQDVRKSSILCVLFVDLSKWLINWLFEKWNIKGPQIQNDDVLMFCLIIFLLQVGSSLYKWWICCQFKIGVSNGHMWQGWLKKVIWCQGVCVDESWIWGTPKGWWQRGLEGFLTHTIHGTGIFTYIFLLILYGKWRSIYTSPMDPMGY